MESNANKKLCMRGSSLIPAYFEVVSGAGSVGRESKSLKLFSDTAGQGVIGRLGDITVLAPERF